MPTTDIIILSAIVFAFLALSRALAWGDYQTARASRERALTAARVTSSKQKAKASVEA
jgi:hypothetical protein